MNHEDDLETWLLDVGDAILHKRSVTGDASLTALEQGLHALWVIDYAVRNSGTLEPVAELRPGALDDLLAFANANGLAPLGAWLASAAAHEETFCVQYLQRFAPACAPLRQLWERA